jgi:NADPH:quinone reductase-like Zn-dependent oxidoreductase
VCFINLPLFQGLAFVEDVGSPIIIQPDEVLVEVVASSVDPVDVAICGGYARSLRHQLGV